MERSKLGFLIGIVALGSLVGIFTPMYFISNLNYDSLSSNYDQLLSNYQILTGDYNTLFDNYEDLESKYNAIYLLIKQQALPIQYSIFAEAVRRYYLPIYFDSHWNETEPEYWMAYAKFCRDIVLHDSGQYNAFSEVSNAFSGILHFGNDTMGMAEFVLKQNLDESFGQYKYYMEIDFYDEFDAINAIHERCIDIDYGFGKYHFWQAFYEGDSTIQRDWFFFPVETSLRNKGGNEDQAIFEASHLKYDNFETIMWFVYDPVWFDDYFYYVTPDYHINAFVHINDTDYFYDNYPGYLVGFSEGIDPYYLEDEGTWCPLELGIQDIDEEPFGTFPSWIENYEPSDGAIVTIILCDIDGGIEQIII